MLSSWQPLMASTYPSLLEFTRVVWQRVVQSGIVRGLNSKFQPTLTMSFQMSFIIICKYVYKIYIYMLSFFTSRMIFSIK